MQQLNPQTKFTVYNDRLTNQNAVAILSAFDVIVDGSDNFATRYLVNDACVLLNKPLVYGAISQYEGQVAVFNVLQNNERSANYRDLFPHPPKEGEVLNCAEAGVLGVLPATPTYTLLAQIFSFTYFAFFGLLWLYSKNEKTKPLPVRLS